jgi:selenium-binding protein 1
MPHAGDELHHFGWNACSACLCPHAAHPHVERRYLVVPGIHSSRIHVIDTKPDPRKPQIVKVIEPETLAARTGYASPHTVHCGPDGILMSALGAPDGDGPGGIFVMDHESFDVLGKWELDRGPQKLAQARTRTWAGLRHSDEKRAFLTFARHCGIDPPWRRGGRPIKG